MENNSKRSSRLFQSRAVNIKANKIKNISLTINLGRNKKNNSSIRQLAEESILLGKPVRGTLVYTTAHSNSSAASTKPGTSSVEFQDITNTVFPVQLNLCIATEELQEVMSIIRTIESIDLNIKCLQSENVIQLAESVKALADLPCMERNQAAKNVIISAPGNYFRSIIQSMTNPNNHIAAGNPGFTAYNNQLRHLDALIRRVDNILLKENLITPEMSLSLPIPNERSLDSFDDLPPTLDAFIMSIDNTDFCKIAWETRFKKYENKHELLSDYFVLIEGYIRQLSPTETVSANCVIHKIQHFAEYLQKRSSNHALEISMLMDVATDAATPKPAPKFKEKSPRATALSNSSVAYEHDLRELKLFLNNIADFDNFKHMFSNATATELSIHDRIVTILNKFPKEKIEFLSALKECCNQDLAEKPYSQFLSRYIDQCLQRIKNPLSDELLDRFHSLQGVYDPPFYPRDIKKYDFLKTWLDMITTNPGLSYAECHRLAEAGNPSGVDIQRHWFDFFDPRRHRCRQLMQEILDTEDYAIYNPRNHN